MKIKPTHKAYLASAIDCEGCICLYKRLGDNNRQYYKASLAIAMNDNHIVKLFQKYYGGNILIGNGRRKNGSFRHDCYVIKYSHEKTKKILQQLLPYLIVKVEQAKVALKFIETKERFEQYRQKNNCFGRLPNHIEKQYETLYNKCRSLKSHYWIKNVAV